MSKKKFNTILSHINRIEMKPKIKTLFKKKHVSKIMNYMKSDKKNNSNKKELTPVEKLLQDNQISRAVDLITGINLFSNNQKITPTATFTKNPIQNKLSSVNN